MSFNINRLKRFSQILPGRDTEKASTSDLPLDHRFTFFPSPGERWTFDEDRRDISLNDASVTELIHDGANDVGLLCGLSQGIYEYQQHVWAKGGKGREKFNAIVGSLQGTILGRLGSIYEGLTGGVRFESDGDNFWINNVNVRSVLALYRLKPTEKARQYLSGLRDKLGLILETRRTSTRYDGISEPARRLFDEISLALEFIPPDAPLRLGDGARVS